MNREEILEKAKVCVCGNREEDYGNPESNFDCIAELWQTYLTHCADGDVLNSKDVAVMMILLKIARIASGHGKSDNWVDIAGYAACGGEIEDEQTDEATNYIECYKCGSPLVLMEDENSKTRYYLCSNCGNKIRTN